MYKIMEDFGENPQKYMSYRKFVKCAIKDYRQVGYTSGHWKLGAVSYPSSNPDEVIVFKIDGAKIHKKMKDVYQLVAPFHLAAYGKTKEEFYDDWKNCHEKKRR